MVFSMLVSLPGQGKPGAIDPWRLVAFDRFRLLPHNPTHPRRPSRRPTAAFVGGPFLRISLAV